MNNNTNKQLQSILTKNKSKINTMVKNSNIVLPIIKNAGKNENSKMLYSILEKNNKLQHGVVDKTFNSISEMPIKIFNSVLEHLKHNTKLNLNLKNNNASGLCCIINKSQLINTYQITAYKQKFYFLFNYAGKQNLSTNKLWSKHYVIYCNSIEQAKSYIIKLNKLYNY